MAATETCPPTEIDLRSRLLTSDSLLESGRVARRPLLHWLRALCARLEHPPQDPEATRGQIALAMNDAALMEVFRGNPKRAWELCALQLEWIAGLVRSPGSASAAALATQPWIHLGRLLRARGDHSAARRHFALALAALAEETVALGPVTVRLSREPGRLTSLGAIYVVDSARSFFAAGDPAGALAFVRQLPASLGAGTALADETELIALAQLGRDAEAMDVTTRPSWTGSPHVRLVRNIYRLALLAVRGGSQSVRGALALLIEKVLASRFDEHVDTRSTRCLWRLAELARACELPRELSEPLVRLGLRAARRVEEQPLELEFLELLLAQPAPADHAELVQARETLLKGCLYVALRKARGLPPASEQAEDAFDALHAALRACARTASGRVPEAMALVREPCAASGGAAGSARH